MLFRSEAIKDKFKSVKDILGNVEEARQHLIDTLNKAVSKEPEVDPARWQRDQSYILHAFDALVKNLRDIAAKAEAAKSTAAKAEQFQKNLFSADQKKALKVVSKFLTSLLSKQVPYQPIKWDALLKIKTTDQALRRQQMTAELMRDPRLQGITPQQAKMVVDLIDQVWQSHRDKLIKKEYDRLMKAKDWPAKLKETLAKSEIKSKLFDLISAGALTNGAFYKVIAKEYGFRDLTPKEASRLVEIVDKLRDPDLKSSEQMELIGEFKKILSEIGSPSTIKMLLSLWYSSVLFSLRTLIDIAASVLKIGRAHV